MNVSLREQFFCLAPVPHMGICRSCQKRSNHGYGIGFYFLHRTFCDHVAATRSGFRTHLNDPVRFRKDLCIVIYQQYGISIRDQIVHHTVKTDDIRRMKADRRFIQYIQHPCRAVSDCPGQLHTLALPGRQSRCRSIQCQIAKPQIH